jgi:hypothetical protein
VCQIRPFLRERPDRKSPPIPGMLAAIRAGCSDETGEIRKQPAGGAAPATDMTCQALPAMQ